MVTNNNPITTLLQKPQPQTLKLSQGALAQHTRLTSLTEQNELLMIKVKKCRDAIQNHEKVRAAKEEEMGKLEAELKSLREQNRELGEREDGVKGSIKENYGQIDDRNRKIKDFVASNQRIQRECIQIMDFMAKLQVQRQGLKAKISKKQQIYEQSQRNIHELQQQKKRIQADIAGVEKQIRKMEDLLAQYKDPK